MTYHADLRARVTHVRTHESVATIPVEMPLELPPDMPDDPDVMCAWIRSSLIALGLLDERPLSEWKRVRSKDQVVLVRPYIPGEPAIVIPKKGGFVAYDVNGLLARAQYISPEDFARDYVK